VYSGDRYIISTINKASPSANCYSLHRLNGIRESGEISEDSYSFGNRIFKAQMDLSYTNIDFDSSVTSSDTSDDRLEFEASRTFIQAIELVNYLLYSLTEDGLPKSRAGASYLLDNQGRIKTGIVRESYTSYSGTHQLSGADYPRERELVAAAYGLEISYDIREITGLGNFNVSRNIGLDQASLYQLFPTAVYSANVENVKAFGNPEIISVNLNVKSRDEAGQILVASKKLKATSIYSDSIIDQTTIHSLEHSGNVHNIGQMLNFEQIGRPLLYEDGDDEKYVMIPLSSLLDIGSESALADQGIFYKGKLVFFKPNGCAASDNCGNNFDQSAYTPGASAQYVVHFGDDQRDFYPTHVQEILDEGFKPHLVVSGMGVEGGKIKPMVATLAVAADKTIPEQLSEISVNNSDGCSVDKCKLQTLKDSPTSTGTIHDAVNGFLHHDNKMFTVALSKDDPFDQKIEIFQTSINSSGGVEDFLRLKEVNTSLARGRVVTAVSDKPLLLDGKPYAPVCLSRSLPCTSSCPEGYAADEDGRVVLLSLDPSAEGGLVEVASHNYKCSSLDTFGDHLFVGGRLKNTVITPDEIKGISLGYQTPVIINTDEKAEENENHYADTFAVDVSGLKGPDGAAIDQNSDFTWNTGMHIQTFSNGRIGAVFGNRFLDEADANISDQSVLSVQLSKAGEALKLLTSIQTDMRNLNNSLVHMLFSEQDLELPSGGILPGRLVAFNSPRGKMLPLPDITSNMTNMWLPFFLNLNNPVESSDRGFDLDNDGNEDVGCVMCVCN